MTTQLKHMVVLHRVRWRKIVGILYIYESSSVGDNSSYSCGLTNRAPQLFSGKPTSRNMFKANSVILQQDIPWIYNIAKACYQLPLNDRPRFFKYLNL
jgi:hypothetical protein